MEAALNKSPVLLNGGYRETVLLDVGPVLDGVFEGGKGNVAVSFVVKGLRASEQVWNPPQQALSANSSVHVQQNVVANLQDGVRHGLTAGASMLATAPSYDGLQSLQRVKG